LTSRKRWNILKSIQIANLATSPKMSRLSLFTFLKGLRSGDYCELLIDKFKAFLREKSFYNNSSLRRRRENWLKWVGERKAFRRLASRRRKWPEWFGDVFASDQNMFAAATTLADAPQSDLKAKKLQIRHNMPPFHSYSECRRYFSDKNLHSINIIHSEKVDLQS